MGITSNYLRQFGAAWDRIPGVEEEDESDWDEAEYDEDLNDHRPLGYQSRKNGV